MTIEPLARRSLPDGVFDRLASRIVHGDIAPGDTLPSERELAEALGVNRGAVREGLQRLAHAGLVRVRHGGPTRVLDFRRTASLDLLTRLLVDRAGRVDVEVARSIIEMRAALAPDVARLAARRVTPELADAVQQAASRIAARPPGDPALPDVALEFWEVLVGGSGNIAYELAYNSLRRAYEPIAGLLASALAGELGAGDDYRALAGAVSAGHETVAAEIATDIVSVGTEAMLAVLDRLPAPVRADKEQS